ncbi:MAG: ComEC/Rec2 family competence protein [Candidatus Falkowbacteria bacterium]
MLPLNPRKLKIVALSLFIVAAVFLCLAYWPRPWQTEVDFLNVGQGDAILIQTPYGQRILIDGGPDSSSQARLGEVLPWYARTIDLLILTHPHDDHVAGLIKIVSDYRVLQAASASATSTSPAFLSWLRIVNASQQQVVRLVKGQNIPLGPKCNLQVLWADDGQSANNSSAVLKYTCGEFSVLLMGDLEEKEERKMLAELKGQLSARVLKVAHHGSDLATSQDFITAVGPEMAVISVGKNNFGHPSSRVITRLTRYGVQVYRTDQQGTIRVVSDGGRIWLR